MSVERKTGIVSGDRRSYKREYMRKFRATTDRTPAGKPKKAVREKGEWLCPTCKVPISVERDACPFCGVTR